MKIKKSVSTRLNAAMGTLAVVMDQTDNAVSIVVDGLLLLLHIFLFFIWVQRKNAILKK